MAESPEDKDVDALIADLQSTLDKLKTAQGKDVDDEDSDDESDEPKTDEPKAKNLQQAERVAFVRVRAHRRAKQAQANSGTPEAGDGLK